MRYSILFAVLICYLELTLCQPPGPDTTGAQPPQPHDQTTGRPQPPDQTTSRPQPPDQTTSRPQPSQPSDQTTSRPQPPDQTGTGGACSTMNIAACTCYYPVIYPSDMANCDILQDAFDVFSYTVGCFDGQCSIECTNDADCGILAAGGLDTACDGVYCVPCDPINLLCTSTATDEPDPQQTDPPVNGASCNSIKFYDENGAYPEHFCMRESIDSGDIVESVNYVCDEQGGAIMNIWDNIDCSGAPLRSIDPCDHEAQDSDCRYAMSCGGDTCDYATIEQWYRVTCDGDIPVTDTFESYYSTAYVIGECINEEGSSSKIVCSGSVMTRIGYDGADCDPGLSIWPFTTFANECDDTMSLVQAISVTCSGESIPPDAVTTTVPAATTTSPIETTESPPTTTETPSATTEAPPTTTTDDGDGDDDSPESGACGVKVSSFMILFAVSLYFIAN